MDVARQRGNSGSGYASATVAQDDGKFRNEDGRQRRVATMYQVRGFQDYLHRCSERINSPATSAARTFMNSLGHHHFKTPSRGNEEQDGGGRGTDWPLSFIQHSRNQSKTLPHLTKVYHLVSCTGTNEADRMVQLSQASGCHSGVAGVE